MAACSCLVSATDIYSYIETHKSLADLHEAIDQCIANHDEMLADSFRTSTEINKIQTRKNTLTATKSDSRLSEAWMAVVGYDNQVDLAEILLASRDRFREILESAESNGQISALSQTKRNRFVNAFAILRDCQHFPFAEDGKYLPAQIIGMADMRIDKASTLFDDALGLGSLELAIGNINNAKFWVDQLSDQTSTGQVRDIANFNDIYQLMIGMPAFFWAMISKYVKDSSPYRGYPEQYLSTGHAHINYGNAIEASCADPPKSSGF